MDGRCWRGDTSSSRKRQRVDKSEDELFHLLIIDQLNKRGQLTDPEDAAGKTV